MKRTHVPKGEVVFIGGRRVRWSQSKRGGVNFYTDDDCPVVVGESSEVVDCREKTLGEQMISDFQNLSDDLAAGRPIEATQLRRNADGTFVREKVTLTSKKARMG